MFLYKICLHSGLELKKEVFLNEKNKLFWSWFHAAFRMKITFILLWLCHSKYCLFGGSVKNRVKNPPFGLSHVFNFMSNKRWRIDDVYGRLLWDLAGKGYGEFSIWFPHQIHSHSSTKEKKSCFHLGSLLGEIPILVFSFVPKTHFRCFEMVPIK